MSTEPEKKPTTVSAELRCFVETVSYDVPGDPHSPEAEAWAGDDNDSDKTEAPKIGPKKGK